MCRSELALDGREFESSVYSPYVSVMHSMSHIIRKIQPITITCTSANDCEPLRPLLADSGRSARLKVPGCCLLSHYRVLLDAL